jgi:DNA-binding transcriptional LysR family regulator
MSTASLDSIEFLTATVAAGSFAGAARKLGVTASAVSRRVAQLERELGVLLLARTTRSLRLTQDGQAFHERCLRIQQEFAEARDAIARVSQKPSGLLRVDVPVALGRAVIVPSLARFLKRYPELRVHLSLRDQHIDPVAEGSDLLVRIGALRDSNLIARKLGESSIVHVAAPAYLKRRGQLRHPRELARHECVGYLRDGLPEDFKFSGADAHGSAAISGQCHANDAEAIRDLAIAGRGVAALFDFVVREPLARGALVRVLADHPGTTWPIHALYPTNRHLLPKLRVFVDHLAELWRRPG